MLLIVCGSATSWIIRHILSDHGGFYNRVTRQIHLEPFSLSECEEYFAAKGLAFNRNDIIESYMVFGGIPYYLHMIDRRLSLSQNIDELLFKKNGSLYYEYDRLFQSLYRNADRHLAVMDTISARSYGKTRTEILESIPDFSDGEKLTRVLEELEQCGFIRKYRNYTKKVNGHYFQIIDPFSLFYLKFLKKRRFGSWQKYIRTPAYYSWMGYAFEMVCINHIDRIKTALGISGVDTMEYTWASRKAGIGAQIDLLIDREDNVINVCEMKYSRSPFSIDQEYESKLENKLNAFAAETGTSKSLHLTMICAAGLDHNKHSGIVVNEISGEELF